MAPPKAKKVAASVAPEELVVMTAKESVKYGGKRHLPGDQLLALPDDVEWLTNDGLAEVAEVVEVEKEEPK
jgi:hypothetical protein